MLASLKVTWSKVMQSAIHVIIFMILAVVLVACTKTEDYLRNLVIKNSDFVDPSSAMFRNITHNSKYWDVWCGEINAKNRVGGYVGWKPFKINVYKDGEVSVTVLQPEEVPFGANSKLRDATENLNKLMADMYASDCKETKPAFEWVPFWR